MTAQERDNTRWNVIEVETEYNVPRSAKLVLSAVKYTDLPEKVSEYFISQQPDYDVSAVKLTKLYRSRWNRDFEWEQEKEELNGYWMGRSAFNHWYTFEKNPKPTCDTQISHCLFFQKVV